jgi:hypothetical protein
MANGNASTFSAIRKRASSPRLRTAVPWTSTVRYPKNPAGHARCFQTRADYGTDRRPLPARLDCCCWNACERECPRLNSAAIPPMHDASSQPNSCMPPCPRLPSTALDCPQPPSTAPLLAGPHSRITSQCVPSPFCDQPSLLCHVNNKRHGHVPVETRLLCLYST